jgi:hypothetical protein
MSTDITELELKEKQVMEPTAVVAEGGETAEPEKPRFKPKKSGSKSLDRKLAKHGDAIAEFKMEVITKESPMFMDRPMTDKCWIYFYAVCMVATLAFTIIGFTGMGGAGEKAMEDKARAKYR